MFAYMKFPSWISPTVVPFLPIRWYAVMYLVAFFIAYVLFRYQCKRGALGSMDEENSINFFCYVIGFLIIGARVFSCLLYDGTWYYWTHPWLIFWPFRDGQFIGLPGMSYHGGVIGGIFGCWLFSRKYKYKFFDLADSLTAAIPLGYTFGRLGNFINGELWGRVTSSRIGMVFPDATRFSAAIPWVREIAEKVGMEVTGTYINLPRHPSQLYEALFEGIILWLILWFIVRPLRDKQQTQHGPGMICGSYFLGYGLFRFVIEYFREPDSQIGFIIALGKETEPLALFQSVLNISLGQILCLLMIIGGTIILVRSFKTPPVVYIKKKGKKNAGK